MLLYLTCFFTFLLYFQILHILSISFHTIYMENFDIRKDLEDGLKNREFQVYLQPKFDCRTEKMVGAESLIRRVKDGNLIMPNAFIPLYEQADLIAYIDNFVLEEVCKLLQKWQQSGKYCYVSVNESAKHLSNKNHGMEVMKILNRYQVSPQLIELEVTESAIIQDMELAKKAEEKEVKRKDLREKENKELLKSYQKLFTRKFDIEHIYAKEDKKSKLTDVEKNQLGNLTILE